MSVVIVKAESWGWGDAKTLAFIAGGLVLLLAMALIELRVKTPLLPPSLFTKRSLTLGVTSVMLALFAMYGVLFYLTLYLENVHGYDPVAAGVRLLPLTMLFFVSAPLGALLNDRLGPRFAIPFGMACLTVAMSLFLFLHSASSYVHLWPSFVLIGLGVGIVLVSATEAIVGSAPIEEAGIAGGIQAYGLQLGGVLGASVLGSVLSSRVGTVLVSSLRASGVPAALSAKLIAAKPLVAEGIAPHVASVPAQLQAAITAGSDSAFMSGLHLALVVGACICALTVVLGLFVPRAEPEELGTSPDQVGTTRTLCRADPSASSDAGSDHNRLQGPATSPAANKTGPTSWPAA